MPPLTPQLQGLIWFPVYQGKLWAPTSRLAYAWCFITLIVCHILLII
jgi:hypothetical protein